MRIAYLVNQYPKISHVFIRREILALEDEGVQILRVSIRRSAEPGQDPVDQDEGKRTIFLLDAGWTGLIRSIFVTALFSGWRFLVAIAAALRLGWVSDRNVVFHLVYLAEACQLLRLLRREKIDHLHAHFGTNSTTVALLCKILGGPTYSFTVHGPEEFDRAHAIGLAEKIAKASLVFAISNFGRSQLYRYTPHAHWAKIHIVRCGVDAAFVNDEPQPLPSCQRLVSIGRLCEQKGQMVLILALGQLHREGIDLSVDLVGDGEMRKVLEEAIGAEGISEHVHITGWADSQTIRQKLDESRAMVLPSFAEGLPVVLMEAMARGRPVVSTYVAGIPELVIPGKNGWLVPAGSVESLAEALRALVNTSESHLEEMGQNGRRAVMKLHHSPTLARELLQLFFGILKSASLRGRGQHGNGNP